MDLDNSCLHTFNYHFFITRHYITICRGVSAIRNTIHQELNRLKTFWIILNLAFITAILLSFDLWHSKRTLEIVPILNLPIYTNFFFEQFTIISLIALPCLNIFLRKPKYITTFLLFISVVVVLGDLIRLQTWFYQYLFLYFIFAYFYFKPISEKNLKITLNCCRILIIGMYFWAGFHKLNITFISSTLPWLLSPFINLSPTPILLIIGIITGLFEIAIAFALLSLRFRKIGIIMAIIMHTMVLLVLGPLGHNLDFIVWPWNIAMAAFVYILFDKSNENNFRDILFPKNILQFIVILFFVLLPSLSLINRWDSYLSFKLYSASTQSAILIFKPEIVERLAPKLQKIMRNGELNIFEWATLETAGPAYPEERYYRGVLKNLCKQYGMDSKTTLKIRSNPHWLTGVYQWEFYNCLNQVERY